MQTDTKIRSPSICNRDHSKFLIWKPFTTDVISAKALSGTHRRSACPDAPHDIESNYHGCRVGIYLYSTLYSLLGCTLLFSAFTLFAYASLTLGKAISCTHFG